MSIEAVLKIGKIYRDNNILDEHRYVNKMSDEIKTMSKNKDSKGQSIETIIYSIPVRSNKDGIWHIHVGEKEVIDQLNEDVINELRYLNYKTSDKDSLKKYLFGNIIYSSIEKGGKITEGGNYRLEGTSSFFRGKPEVEKVESIVIQSFSKSFEENIIELENLLRSHSAIGLCFDFEGKQWYEVEGAMDAVNQKLISEFVVERTLSDGKKVISLGKSLFKTIKSPLFDKEKNRFNDPDGIGGSMPGFRNSGGHKIRNFETLEEVIDLFYAINTAEKKFVKRIKDIGILALPKSEHLTVRQLNNFFNSKSNYENTEEKLLSDLSSNEFDDLFDALINNELPSEVSFDIIFMKPPGMSAPSIDLIEISNLERSFLRDIHHNIREKRQQIEMQLAEETVHFKKPLKINFNISDSFYQLFDNRTKDQKKYQSHLLKILPQIYSDTYFRDPVLLPLFIEQVEYDIRNADKQPNYLILKYHFRFLTSIQKENNMEEITNSQSYKLGKSLGTMSRPFAAWQKNCPIKSFEKSYVGNLTRRVSRLDDVFVLYNYLCEKHTNHPTVIYQEHREAVIDFAEIRKQFNGPYDRNHCAFGFFDAYFSRDKNESDKDQNP
jgi:hypothetical protein